MSGQGGAAVIVNQSSDRAIINWNTFNVGAGESARFNQPSAGSITLNRVVGGLGPSQINGTVSANGRIFLINRDGILFGPTATVDTAGFLATTHDIRNDDFMAGRFTFGIPGNPQASIVNQGTITAHNAGFAALVAPGVRNTGTITATLGTVSLASGNGFTLDFYGDRLITLGVTDSIAANVIDVATGQPLSSLVKNEGVLRANGGRVEMTAATARRVVDSVINNTGTIEANTFRQRGGTIVLSAGTGATKVAGAPRQTIRLSGTLSAAAKKKGKGGKIVVTAENIEVVGARIDASGKRGGGTVLIGGDWSGGNPVAGIVSNPSARLESTPVATATTVSVDGASIINASATASGNGGKVIVWSDQTTTFAGTILARGGAASGDGGFVETSGHQVLNFTGNVDTRAPNGAAGTLLLDPFDVTISTGSTTGGPFSGSTYTPSANSSILNAAELSTQLQTSNVVVTTGGAGSAGAQNGDITVASPVTWSSNTTLTLSAFRNINVTFTGTSVMLSNTGGGSLILRADNSGSGVGTISLAAGTFSQRVDWSNSTGTVAFYYNPTSYTAPTNFTTGNGQVVTNGNVPNQFTAYMLVNTVANISSVSSNLAGIYALGKNIDATTFGGYGAGTIFAGVFDGNGGLGVNSTISNLTVSLFPTVGTTGTVRNLNLTNVAITVPGAGSVGALAGINQGAISNVGVTGAISGGVGSIVGGLVAVNDTGGTITGSFVGGSVTTAGNVAGGLVGSSVGSITNSYSIATVSGAASSAIGGLVGVLGTGSMVATSFATGAVNSSSGNGGGLVGSSNAGSTITNSYWDILTSGRAGSAGGTGLTTAALQANLQGGWSPSVWGIIPGVSYPFLNSQFTSGTPQVVSGIAFSDRATTSVAGVTVNGLVNGTALASVLTGGAVTTGANGYYYYLLAPGTISTPALQVLTYTTGATGGATFQNNAGGSVTGLNIYGTYLRDVSGATTLSGVASARTTAIGANPSVQTLVNGLANREIDATGANFAIDQSINTGTLVLSNTGAVTQSAPIAAANLALLGAGGSYTLTNTSNQIAALAAKTETVSIADAVNLNIGTVAGTSGVTVSGALTLNASGHTISAPVPVSAGTFILAGGNWVQNDPALAAFQATDFRISGGSFLRVTGGAGTAASPYSIADVYGLQGIKTFLASSFTLANDLNAASATAWNAGTGFAPIGSLSSSFTGTFDGLSHTINNITIAPTATTINNIGMFAAIGTAGVVRNLSVANATVTANANLPSPGQFVGILAGTNSGTISNVTVSGAVNGGALAGVIAGGLVGQNQAGALITLSASAANVAVGNAGGGSGQGNDAGGLVGNNLGTITQSSASGTISGGTSVFIGGLVGRNDNFSPTPAASISNSSASGNVTVAGGAVFSSSAGGLVGFNGNGSITNSSATGNVTVGAFAVAGGLVGQNEGLITQSSYRTGTVSGSGSGGLSDSIGGLVGDNAGTVKDSSAVATVTGANVSAGGLVGRNTGTIIGTAAGLTFANATVTVSGDNSSGGGLVGTNDTGGAIQNVTAAGSVAPSGAASVGDFLTLGGLVGQNRGSISFANAAVTVNGLSGTLGGLVGENDGTIANSSASGNVTGGAAAIAVGGLVGTSSGSIASSQAAGAVSGAGFVGGLVGGNQGAITQSSASGAVGGNAAATLGGLVGYNDTPGTITNSSASGNVTGGTTSVAAGGFAGFNLGTITNSQATGTVSGAGIVGGFVGYNGGTIDPSTASGAVNGNAGSVVGGFAGENAATITQASATGSVTGGDGSTVGGLVAFNILGTIMNSSAGGAVSGRVGSTVGGLVGNNLGGTVTNSFATGNVTGGATSNVGGFVGSNFDGTITGSYATGNVTTGLNGIAGGFVGTNTGFPVPGVIGAGTIGASHATGNVTGGDISIIGGFFGINLLTSIDHSYATGTVIGGNQSTAGGFGGLNLGTVNVAFASGPVTGGNNSFVGGFAGVNFAVVDPNITTPTGVITQAYAFGPTTGGTNSFVAAFAAVNVGSLDQTLASGLVTAGAGSTTGGLVASNTFNYVLPPTVTPYIDPPGTATNSYWDTQSTGQANSAGGTGQPTAQLVSGLPAGFDPSVWAISAGQSYPFLIDPSPTPTPTPSSIPPVPPPVVPPTPPDVTPLPPTDIATVLAGTPIYPTQQLNDQWRDPNTTPTVQGPLVTPTAPSSTAPTPNGRPNGSGNPPNGPRVSGVPPANETRYIKDQVVFRVCGDVPAARVALVARRLGMAIISSQRVALIDCTVYQYRITDRQSVSDKIRRLEALRLIDAAQPNYVFVLAQSPPVPAPAPPALAQVPPPPAAAPPANEGDPAQYLVAKLRLPEVHRIARGTGIRVAVIDSEIDAKHPDLEGTIMSRFDAVGVEDKPHPHGTGMAGAIVSHKRLIGVAPGVQVLAIHAFGAASTGGQGTSMQIVKGLDWAVTQGARVVNMSFAGPKDPILQQAIKVVHDKGIVLFAAAGNAGPKSPPLYPGADPNVIAVTATDEDDKSYTGANRGKYVAIAAPGVDVLVPAPDGTYQLTTGTSVATAEASGVAALLLEKDPKLTPEEIRSILTSTAKKLGTETRDDEFGYGLVDPLKALTSLTAKQTSLEPAWAPAPLPPKIATAR